jgi:Fe-S-cluster containining protein
MDWSKPLYPDIQQLVQEAIPDNWPELRMAFGGLLEEPPIPVVTLPLLSCRAVGGQPSAAVPVSAALVATEVTLRILDDPGGGDWPGQLWQKVGQARAWNYAAAIHILSFEILSKAPLSPKLFHKINQLFIDAFFYITAGQDRDIAANDRTIEDYWETIEWKTATAFAAACAAGAMVGTEDPALIEAIHTFGHHLGLGFQIINDLESVWLPDGKTALKHGQVTLPLLYGMLADHPGRDELMALVESNKFAANAGRVQEILDQSDTKAFLIWAALKERDQALEAITILPDTEGHQALESFVSGMFDDIDRLLKEEAKNYQPRTAESAAWPTGGPNRLSDGPGEEQQTRLVLLERQIVRGTLFTHTAIGQNSVRLYDAEPHLYGLIDVLTAKGLLSAGELSTAVDTVRKKRAETGFIPSPAVSMRIDNDQSVVEKTVNCAERLPICQAVCCRLAFPLNQEEIEAGRVKWDLGHPYFIRREPDGYCSHIKMQTKSCSLYGDRPAVCRNYSCASDKRIWKEFEKMELNVEWIEANVTEPAEPRLIGLLMQDVEIAPPDTALELDHGRTKPST